VLILLPLGPLLAVPLSFSAPVVSSDLVEVLPEQRVPGAAILAVTSGLLAGNLTLSLSGGTDGERYAVRVLVTLSDGTSSSRDLNVAVVDPTWLMPGGGPSYLSLFEFVSRFGLDEAITATQSSADGLIDRAFLIGALSDAQAEVEANLAGRYALPLSVVPALVKAAIADLAAVRMYRRGAPDFIAEQAKVQRRVLERIASGALPLPIPTGSTVDPAPSDAPVLGWNDGGAYSDSLKGY
jgi:phage gp36-like protein